MMYREPTKREVRRSFKEMIENYNREIHQQYMENLRNMFRKTINPNAYTEQVLGVMQMPKLLKKNE